MKWVDTNTLIRASNTLIGTWKHKDRWPQLTHSESGGMVGTHAGDMIGEVALAIEMGADAIDIGKTIHPHPTLGESIGMAAEVAHGSCTDLPPSKK